jgi:hypothetical protein
MSHEQSITVQNAKGRWVNIPTVYNGKKVKDARALQLHNQGLLPALGGKTYATEPPASARAAKRSWQTPEDHSKKGIRPPGARR